ncbi:MAG: ATP-binding protein, partial [Tannerellaceae bacterium]|nr:ATP-binding protein [Tannerellaceae bacterium]
NLILGSVKLNNSDKLDYSPFLLSSENENSPTFFEIIFLLKDGKRFRYGFEYNQTDIINEWLFTGKSAKNENPLFVRTKEGIAVSEQFEEGKGKESATNDNRLFVSLVAQLGGKTSQQVMGWFMNCNTISGIANEGYLFFSLLMLQKKTSGYEESLSFFKKLELGFTDLKVIESEITKESSNRKLLSVKTAHNKYNKNGDISGTVLLDREENESEGTKKILDLAGPIFDTLKFGKILIIDELDAKLHPLITMEIIKLFNSPHSNPNHAQLLFATHDTNLLSADLFRRDQIWFTEKDEREQTDLYALYDFNLPDGTKVRNDANLEKNYIRGRYGAIPFITH